MFNPDFYPTPSKIACIMWEAVRGCSYVLEPSAGRGDLLDWIKKETEHGHRKSPHCDAIELNSELQLILTGKGHNLIHDDFMTFQPSRIYDGIIMNPPFHVGAKHLLRAWDILDNGVIVCLLNFETVHNVCNRERTLLSKIITEHGEVRELGSCFFDAARKTSVEVSMVTLRKEEESSQFGFFDSMGSERDESIDHEFNMDVSSVTDLSKPNLVESMEDMYRSALEAHKGFLKAKNKVMFYVSPLSSSVREGDLLTSNSTDSVQYNNFVDTLNGACWDTVFEKTDISRFVTEGVRKEFDSFRGTTKRIDFTAANIRKMVQTLGMSIGTIMESAILDIFDSLTRYDKKNTVHVEGWKTNDTWRVNRKVIIPNITGVGWRGEPEFSYWAWREELSDIDRVMCNLDQKDFNKIVTIRQALEAAFVEGWGTVADSEFFRIKFYKKGTIHMEFKDEGLLARFNQTAAKGKNWLPGER